MTDASGPQWPALCAGEVLVRTAQQILWRQVHPRFVDDDVVGVGAFVGVNHDHDRVSTALDGLQTARGAYSFHVEVLGLDSAGTWPVTTATVDRGGARTVYDAESECAPDPCPPGHANIDMRALAKAQRRVLRFSLATEATDRGCAHRP